MALIKDFKSTNVWNAFLLNSIATTIIVVLAITIQNTFDVIYIDKNNQIIVTSECHTTEKTGVEMEALLSCSITCLTIYDMIKSVDKEASITEVKLVFKSGGKSGIFERI